MACSAAALSILALTGYATERHWQHQWFAASLCEGNLRAADLADVLPDRRLQAGRDETNLDRGRITCHVNRDENHYALAMDAVTDPADVERELHRGFTTPLSGKFAFPAGLPGLPDPFGPVIIQDCPDLARDAQGRKRHLVTTVRGGNEATTSPGYARIAVSMANAASQKLGCGAEPLPMPTDGSDPYEPPRAVEPTEAKDTVCGWLTGLTLPKTPSGAPWDVVPHTDIDAPVTGCSLTDTASGRTAVEFSGWYGDWTDKPFERLLSGNIALTHDFDDRRATMSQNFGRATARCDGEAANYLAFVQARDNEGGDRYLTGRQLRPLLDAFAKSQSERRGCTDLELPPSTIHPRSDP
ncbi:hypothetical protein ACIQVO_36670 [Streptomyces sp. NPDC101062]|uniref:hypothetical protein n=1 Tax=unclassified Streptomyces TaxID=2593676 RepID=UPI00382414D9